jgi:hypothetical protein
MNAMTDQSQIEQHALCSMGRSYDFPRLQARTLPQTVEEATPMIASNSSPAKDIDIYSILGSCGGALQVTDPLTQLALVFSFAPSPKPDLVIDPVPSEFEGDLYCLRYGSFKLRLELPREQAYELFDRTAGFNWSLDDRGVPTDIDRIWAAAESVIEGGLD